ncbi:phytanoyl-CoA dioxygenase family protein [Candidatus Latescibacteria bacterium]|jgi:non-haem Fe2+, alpha-ketoglutarate-dependent halogenase|nr:phytanoyl-CoA dioxygenase family protein [Candidatus Latescibacterota bacterium]
MENLPISTTARRLTPADIKQFDEAGYLQALPVFDQAAAPQLQKRLQELEAQMPDDVPISSVNMWHKANRWIYDLARTPAILDYVEDLIGPDFFQWGGGFFVKYPGEGNLVPWHQDSQYWPLAPRKTVTASLAFYDGTKDNGAMQVLSGSHRSGHIPHHDVTGKEYMLGQEIDADKVDLSQAVTLELKTGEISLHDEALAHGSGPNRADTPRAVLTMRFSPTEVKADLDVWATFESSMARGVDRYQHNPEAKIPTADTCPVRSFQLSAEFA